MATYSLADLSVTSTAFRAALAQNPAQPINHAVDDTYVNTPAREQRAMMLGEAFLARTPSGQQVAYKYDAERSVPGVLRILNRA